MKFSIIVPVYKVPEQYLKQCIESLIQQDIEDYEVILVDDGSPDNCGRICDEYKERCEKITVIHKKNEGVSVARNCGLEIARGNYIMFVDGDDYIFRNSLKKIALILDENNADISFLQYSKTDSKEQNVEYGNVEKIPEQQITNIKKCIMTKAEIFENVCIGSPWGKVFSRDFLEKNGIRYVPGIVKAQDRVFMMNCLKHPCRVQVVDYMYYYYNTENDMSACKRYNDKIFNSLLATGKEIEKLVDREEFAEEIQEMYMKFFMEIILLNVLHKDNPKKISDDVKLMKKIAENEKFSKALNASKFTEYGKFFSIFFSFVRKRRYRTAVIVGKVRFKFL